MFLMIGRLFIIGIAAVAIFSMMTVKAANAEEWWKSLLHRDGEWNCCDGSNGGEFKYEDDSKHEANPDNNQKIEINQKCEHVNNCT